METHLPGQTPLLRLLSSLYTKNAHLSTSLPKKKYGVLKKLAFLKTPVSLRPSGNRGADARDQNGDGREGHCSNRHVARKGIRWIPNQHPPEGLA
jgi:hypothetical protein